ncbi:hypothetical protein RHDE110596_00620 [Prescottella defluvii]|uniref:hypothetical protein n=1 Tax=Prescottella defluvii TaxID=1323361 RepID=UPI001E51803A|nr:hypothetical protein [Prescottella defluvii]
MGKSPGRRSKNRKPKPARVVAKRVATVASESMPEQGFMSLEYGPSCFMLKITGAESQLLTNSIEVTAIPLEDTIMPVELKFPAPLKEFARDPMGFDYHWGRLTYLFDLDDPAEFPYLRGFLSESERAAAQRFVETCKNLASYSVVNDDGGMTLSSHNGEWSVDGDLPSHEAFTGFSTTFRQIHNAGDEASFSKIMAFLEKAAGELEEAQAKETREILQSWRSSRGKLMDKMAATLICERLQPDNRPDVPKTFMGVKPDEIIVTYNYGDSLHWGKHRERLAEMTSDPYNETFYKHACVTAMIQLSHFYFGFAELVAGALGYARVVSS